MATPVRFVALLLIIIAAVFTAMAASLHLELRRVTPKAGAGLSMASVGGRGTTATAPVSWAPTGRYVAEYHLGNPPQVARALVDVGSDLVWTQARTCNRRSSCFQQDLPVYDASQSRTALNVPCTSRTLCTAQRDSRCSSQASVCPISARYDAVGEFTGYLPVRKLAGDLGTDVFTFGLETANITFGRVSDIHSVSASGSWNLAGASGVIGLGRGPLSLVSQLAATKFSYCLTPFFSNNSTSHLFVGSSAGLRDGGAPATSVPFVANPTEEPYSSFYYLPLTGISLGSTRLAIPTSAFEVRRASPGVTTGGTIIDLSTEIMLLVDVAFKALAHEVERQLGDRLLPLQDDSGFSYCVDSYDFSFGRIPSLVLHLGRGGDDLVLPAANYWAPVVYSGQRQEMVCMVVFSSAEMTELPMNETTVIGDYMQQDINVFYDLGSGVVSFQPTDCSSL